MERNKYGSEANLEELRSQLAARLAVLPLAGALLLGAWLSKRGTAVSFPMYGLQTMLLGSGFGVWALTRSRPLLARQTLVWGLITGLVAALWLFRSPDLPLLGTLVVFACGLVVSGGEYVAAVLITGTSVWLVHTEGRTYQVVHLLFGLSAAAVLASLTKHTLYTALGWAWTMQERADSLLEDARDRQGQLASALKSVDTSNNILRRTQRELITARREAEQARRVKEQFAANVSHELRTPLNLILGFSEIMSLSPEVYGDVAWPPSLRMDINQIYRSSRHLLEMIDDVLDLSRFEFGGFALNKEPTQLKPLLEETVQIARDLFRGRPVRLETEIDEGLPVLEIDRIRIRQVLLNLLANAARFTEEGSVRVEVAECGGEVLFAVRDTGPGIPADKVEHLFDEFYQVDRSLRRTHGGFGLGLAISKRFVEAHDGRIWVETEGGKGSTFTFALPVPDAHVPTAHLEWKARPAPPAGNTCPTILVVEPDSAVVDLINRHLDHYKVIQVEQASELPPAIALHHPHAVVRNIPPGNSPPPGLDYEAWLNSPVPLIECSLPSQTWLVQDLEIAACLTKPVTADQLLREINRLESIHDILVVDDDHGFCRLVERMLATSTHDFSVRRAYDGKSGLRELRARRPDLLLLDLIMPDTDGFQVIEEIHCDPNLQDLPIVLLTATSVAEDALAQRGNQFVIRRCDGLQPMEILRCLKATLGVVKPSYDERSIPEDIPASRPMPS